MMTSINFMIFAYNETINTSEKYFNISVNKYLCDRNCHYANIQESAVKVTFDNGGYSCMMMQITILNF
jgi:hypothetical protein